VLVNSYGIEQAEGFLHFFEGWVIFLSCVAILFGLAWLMLFLHPDRPSLATALDLDSTGLARQATRLQYLRPSPALITAAGLGLAAIGAVELMPERGGTLPARDSFALFPRQLGAWEQDGPRQFLSPGVEKGLAADDYHQVTLTRPGTPASVGLFMAWYADQSDGGVHSPEICLPGSGWEIAWLERSDITEAMASPIPFHINRAIIQKGETRMMVYYWFQQTGRRIAWDFSAKYWLMVQSLRTGRTDGALVRLTTLIGPNESDAAAEARLMEVLRAMQDPLPRFIPDET
jgi:exosortase D (VPLPA-CTERM-specific)